MISKKTGLTYPSHTPEAKRRDHLKVLGWTPELFQEVWDEQSGKCANPACQKVLNLSMTQNSSRACADHRHGNPPIPRGILCSTCNIMIGQAQESPSILRGGAEYLEKFSLARPAEVVQNDNVSAFCAGK